MQRKPELLHVVLTLGPGRGLADFLDGRQEQADQNGDDGNHDEQLDEREARGEPLGKFSAHGKDPPYDMGKERNRSIKTLENLGNFVRSQILPSKVRSR